METLQELVQFLSIKQRLDVKAVALTHVLSLTGSDDGKAAILAFKDILAAIFGLSYDSNYTVAKDALLCLINLSGTEADATKLYETANELHPPFPLLKDAIKHITDENSQLAEPWTMILSNLTRVEKVAHHIAEQLAATEKSVLSLAKAFTVIDYNKKKCKLHYLGPVFCNLTQSAKGRELFCRSEYQLLEKVRPFAYYQDSLIRRGGTIGILKNICFDPIYHDLMLNEDDEILSAILYPLCGPEEYNDEEMDKLPLDLQYLPPTKTREEDSDLRKMLLDSLLQLCATKRCREHLRTKGVYEILREYHKWESSQGGDKECLLACENVVDILIKKEEEIGIDNYKEEIEVPEDYTQKFQKEDAEYLDDLPI